VSKDRTLEVHAIVEAAFEHNVQDAIDLASDQDGVTWLTDHGKRIAAIVPVDTAEHGQIIREVPSQEASALNALAAELLALVQQPVLARGHEITQQRWEIKVRGAIARIFRLGMGAGWDKHAGLTRSSET
jgi:hypothetical protein